MRTRHIGTASTPSSRLVSRQRNSDLPCRLTITDAGKKRRRFAQQMVAHGERDDSTRQTMSATVSNKRMTKRLHAGSANLAPGLMRPSILCATASSSTSDRLPQHLEQNAETETALTPSGVASKKPPVETPSAAKDVRHAMHRGRRLGMSPRQRVTAFDNQGSRVRTSSSLSIK
jgi:hypothetical protein